MATYQTTKDGNFLINGKTIPNDSKNRHYQRMQQEVTDGLSTIQPYVQDLEELRREKIQGIKDYGLAQIQNKVDAIDSIAMAKLMYNHMWPLASASQALQDGKAVYDYAASKLSQAKGATREQLEAYDPTTDNGWP